MKRYCEECEKLQKLAYFINKVFAQKKQREIDLKELESSLENFSSEDLQKYIKRAKHLELKDGKVIMAKWWFEKIMDLALD